MSNYKTFGQTDWFLADAGELYGEIGQSDRCTAIYKRSPEGYGAGDLPDLTQGHPLFPWLAVTRTRVIWPQRGFIICEAEFGGDESSSEGGMEANELWEIVAGTSEEPIDAHPDFAKEIGGRPSAPINGAVFTGPGGTEYTEENPAPDESARFSHFQLLVNDQRNEFAGVEAYLDLANVEIRKTWFTDGVPEETLASAGKISVPNPPGGMAVFKDRTWLDLGTVSREYAPGKFQNTRTWRLSGRGGWNKIIYKNNE